MSDDEPLARPKMSLLFQFGGDARRAEDALDALSARIQINVPEEQYEILAVEWESSDLLGEERATARGRNVRYLWHGGPVVPLQGVRWMLEHARARYLGILSGAVRFVTPRLVEHALLAENVDPDPLVVVPSYRLFERSQDGSEDAAEALEIVDCASLGYQLFRFVRLAPAFVNGVLNPFGDVECSFFRRESLESALTGGAEDEASLVRRLTSRPQARLVVLAGEGVFALADESSPAEVERASGVDPAGPTREPLVLGAFSGQVQRFVVDAANFAILFHAMAAESGRLPYPMDP